MGKRKETDEQREKRLKWQREYSRELRKDPEYRAKKAKWNKEWIQNNRERYNAAKYVYREKLKIKVLAMFSGGKVCCAECGEGDVDVLCLDHINDNGADDRRNLKVSGRGQGAGTRMYEAVLREGITDGLQVLCFNCNTKKEAERKRGNRMANPFYVERAPEVDEYLELVRGGDVNVHSS